MENLLFFLQTVTDGFRLVKNETSITLTYMFETDILHCKFNCIKYFLQNEIQQIQVGENLPNRFTIQNLQHFHPSQIVLQHCDLYVVFPCFVFGSVSGCLITPRMTAAVV